MRHWDRVMMSQGSCYSDTLGINARYPISITKREYFDVLTL